MFGRRFDKATVVVWAIVAAIAAYFFGPLLLHVGDIVKPPPTEFKDTLSQMVTKFSAGARVVSVDVQEDSDVTYEVIPADERVHRYMVVASNHSRGRFDRETVRAATAADRQSAVLRLGDLRNDVVDRMYSRLGFRSDDAFLEAKLTGTTWTIGRTFKAGVWTARYDGTGLHQTSTARP